MFGWVLKKVLGSKHEREVKRVQPMVAAIEALEPKLKNLTDDQLVARTAEFRTKLDNGAKLDDLLIPAYATVREASRRVLGMRHYDVQMVGGIMLHEGKIAEMRTGEGKTLVATLPCYLNALPGKGVHVVTVNDYLAKRDAEWMSRLHNFLGLEVGVIYGQQSNAKKKKAYRADITYGQNNEFGFDYLRDNMKFSIYDYVQRDLNFALVDEVDSILIDEARTPLIISGPGETASEKYLRITELIPKFRRDEHYEIDEKARAISLTEDGMEFAQRLLREAGLLQAGATSYRGSAAANLYDPVNLETLHILQQCLRAHMLYHRDQHYMVVPPRVDGRGRERPTEVLIVDEFTGRTMEGRRWSDGLHQAVEAKERVPIQDENITLATISFQNLFRLYDKLSGMTGTADTEAAEFHSTYELDVSVIPTNKPIARVDSEDLVFKSEREKFHAVVDEIEREHTKGRPVLVGTTSVEKSEALARLLGKKGIEHQVLNAKQHEREAYVVAQAGTRGAVTIATNMAGRGTDILLGGNPEMLARLEVLRRPVAEGEEPIVEGSPEFDLAVEEIADTYAERCKLDQKAIKQAGGLHIVGTERHESRRIDNQLRGRAGRQGDPGSSIFFLSLEDDLMRIFAGDRVQGMMDRLGMEENVPIEHPWVTKAVENAQRKVEERNFYIRKHLLEYDDVMNQQRKSIYALRKQVLQGRYQTEPTDEEKKKGATPETLAKGVDSKLMERVKPILEEMVRVHGFSFATFFARNEGEGPGDALASLGIKGVALGDGKTLGSRVPRTPEEVRDFRIMAREAELSELGTLRTESFEVDVYNWFGCVVDLEPFADDPKGALAYLEEQVGWAISEQHERLLDVVDALIGAMVEEHCPPNKHIDDWDLEALEAEFEEVFSLGYPKDAHRLNDPHELAHKLFHDAEASLFKKMDELGAENYLRFFRTVFLENIDEKWIEHLQAMDQLRDGIGLRGYGQRDPKKEYKREGFNLFQEMLRRIQREVVVKLYRVRKASEQDLEALEEQRRQATQKRQQDMQVRHAAANAGGTPEGGAGDRQPAAPARPRAARGGVQLGQSLPRQIDMSKSAAEQVAAQRAAAQQGGEQPGGQPAPREPANRRERRRMAKQQKKKGGKSARR